LIGWVSGAPPRAPAPPSGGATAGAPPRDRAKIAQIAAIERDGSLTDEGYKTTTGGLKDLLDRDHDIARRHVKVAQHVGPRFALDGAPLEPVLPATAAAFTAGATTMRHVGVIASLMNSGSASRISLADRVSIEASLGEAATTFSPRDVRIMGENLLAAADQDGPEPDERSGRDVLHFGTNADGSGWIRGQFHDAEAFATIVTGLTPGPGPRRRSGAPLPGSAMLRRWWISAGSPSVTRTSARSTGSGRIWS
jgi:5-methylcytosine-specific restriction protein A